MSHSYSSVAILAKSTAICTGTRKPQPSWRSTTHRTGVLLHPRSTRLLLRAMGKTDEVEQLLARLQQLSKTVYTPAWSSAMVHIGMGNHDQAFECSTEHARNAKCSALVPV